MTQHNWGAYARLMRLDKPIGFYLLLWPTLWALLIASQGMPALDIAAIFIAGVVVMRCAGCVINDYADRKVDGNVKRTATRPLATGEVTAKQALQLFALLIGIAFVLVLFLNWQTIALSVVALLLAASYPFMKRYTHLPQVVLGAAFGWAIPMAFMAVLETVPAYGWWLFIANLTWTVAYDTMYAMVDRDDDLNIGVKSSAILFGQYDVMIVMALQLPQVDGLLLAAPQLDVDEKRGEGGAPCTNLIKTIFCPDSPFHEGPAGPGCLGCKVRNHSNCYIVQENFPE